MNKEIEYTKQYMLVYGLLVKKMMEKYPVESLSEEKAKTLTSLKSLIDDLFKEIIADLFAGAVK